MALYVGFRHTEKTKRKISEALKGRVFSEETKRKMGEAQHSRKHSEISKYKMSIAHKGKKQYWRGGRVERKCLVCGKIFSVRRSILKYRVTKFCSHKCHGEARRQESIERKCLKCSKTFHTKKYAVKRGEGKYCSRKCHTEAMRQDKVECKCLICGKIFHVQKSRIRRTRVIYCSFKCHGIDAHLKTPKADTSIEKKVKQFLISREIKFQQQAHIKAIAVVDFLLNNKKIIECDGDYWHSLTGKKEKDNGRDFMLSFNGYKVLRLREEDINKHWRKCCNRILKFYERK